MGTNVFESKAGRAVKAAYIKSCQARGIVEGVHGECWVGEPVPDSYGQRCGPYQALPFGSLCEAFCTALSQDPANERLRPTLKRGLEARIVSHKMPEAVSKYLVTLHNRFRHGAGVSFVEFGQTVPDAPCLFP